MDFDTYIKLKSRIEEVIGDLENPHEQLLIAKCLDDRDNLKYTYTEIAKNEKVRELMRTLKIRSSDNCKSIKNAGSRLCKRVNYRLKDLGIYEVLKDSGAFKQNGVTIKNIKKVFTDSDSWRIIKDALYREGCTYHQKTWLKELDDIGRKIKQWLINMLLPNPFSVFVREGEAPVNCPLPGYEEKNLPVFNRYKGIEDGGYIACYSNIPIGSGSYSVGGGIYVVGLIKLKGSYTGRMFVPEGCEGQDLSKLQWLSDLCREYFPDAEGDLWAGPDTGGFFGLQQDETEIE